MAHEIDFLPVGAASKSGDAIALRFGNLNGPRSGQAVVVIDGGTKESGAALVRHVKTHYQTDTVDLAILTHPDADHSSGLTVVLEELKVGALWMHRPWEHGDEIAKILSATDTSASAMCRRARKSLRNACELETLAKRKGINIQEPFSDYTKATDVLKVLSPSVKFYEGQLANFRCMPEDPLSALVKDLLIHPLDKAVSWLTEHWYGENLAEPEEDATSAENNSSMVLLFSFEGRSFLFTSDAGVAALTAAADFSEQAFQLKLSTVNGVQVPHHGSRRNVGPTILNRILGPIVTNDAHTKTAIVSVCCDGEPKHPSRRVVNAFRRRGAHVFTTMGKTLCHYYGVPRRQAWNASEALPFYDQVESVE